MNADEQSKKLKFRISTLIHFNLFSHNSNNKISRKSKWKTKNHILVSRARTHKPEASKQTNQRMNEQTNERKNVRMNELSFVEIISNAFSLPIRCVLVGFFFVFCIRMTQKCIHISVRKVSLLGKSKHTDSQIRTHNNFSTFVIFRESERG